MKSGWIFLLFLVVNSASAQAVKEKLALAIEQMEADPQMRHAIIGFCVADSKTGNTVYEHNAQIGLAPASTQKLFTSCAAFDILGKDYRYTTEIGYSNMNTQPAKGFFDIRPSGDPSFGSSRFAATRPALILENIVTAMRQNKITGVTTNYTIADSAFGNNTIPGGWIWEDIGNYYGAAAHSFNWLENQYDIVLKSGKNTGEKVNLVQTKPAEAGQGLAVQVKSAEKGSGDNTIVFLNNGAAPTLIEGTIPVNEESFTVSASIPDPTTIFLQQLINMTGTAGTPMEKKDTGRLTLVKGPDSLVNYIELYKHVSPSLDSLNYWFLKKSINLYGEAFIKTMAYDKTGIGSTEKGVALLKDFWLQQGIEKPALHIYDGSGLSPQNRVTANALVKVLQFAKSRPWFNSFYYALPVYNGMKMKSGSINGARAFAGYQQAAGGQEYSFAIIVNNYDGSPAAVIRKMYGLLDNLK